MKKRVPRTRKKLLETQEARNATLVNKRDNIVHFTLAFKNLPKHDGHPGGLASIYEGY